MGWWGKFKTWQKGALILGGLHLLVSIFLIQNSRVEGGGLVLVLAALESPWLLLLYIFGVESPGNVLAYTYLPVIIGTVFYGAIGGVLGHIITRLWIKKEGL